jgi:16S rRNA (uracil1498-N3)-methyltransferase
LADTLFYAEVIPTVGAVAVVDGDEGFHAATVRRIRPGERLVLSDGRGVRADCIVEAATNAGSPRRCSTARPSPGVAAGHRGAGHPQSRAPELAIELATEAGADGFMAWQAARCVARWDGERRTRAAPVAGGGPLGGPPPRRAYIPEVNGPITTAALTRSWPNGSALVRWSWRCMNPPPGRLRISSGAI